MRIRDIMLAAITAAVVAAPAVAQVAPATQAAELDRRYIDPINGYSLRPPADAERKRETSRARLISWVHRDAKSRAIVWTLSVGQVFETHDNVDLEPYSKALADRLKREQLFESKKVRLSTLSERPAIDMEGAIGGDFNLYQRQVWVLAEPNRFLVIMLTGPLDAAGSLGAMMDQVLQTLEEIGRAHV